MRSGGEPTSVLWADTAAISASSLSPPLASSAPEVTAMNCFEGLPHHPHHHHLHAAAANIHHRHQTPPPPTPTHVIRLLPSSPGAPDATAPEDGGSSGGAPSPAPRQEAQRTGEEAAECEAPSTPQGSSAHGSPDPHRGPEGTVRVKQEAPEGDEDPKDDSGISPGSGGAAEREPEDEAHLEDSPGGSSRGGGDLGAQSEEGPRSPYSEGCYSEGCEDAADIRRLQYSESAAGGPQYSEGETQGQRPDASDEDEAGGDVNKPRITSQGKFKTFRCKQCDFVALTKLEFWEHSRMHIRAERLLTCPRCPFVTEYKHHLEYHLRNHFGSKPFKCPHCPYTCVNKSMLNSHLKSHSSVYQYRCADCGYATKYCHSLKLHLRKYSHQPAMVLHPDGSPNPLPVIDVYGTRRGPKTGSKKVNQQQGAQDGAVSGAPTSPPSPSAPTTLPPVAPPITTAAITTTSSSGAPFQAMLVYPSSPSPSYANGAGSYYAPATTISSSAYSTPQTSRPILPRVLQPRVEAEDQWHPAAREDHPEGQAKKPSGGPSCVSGNRPVKCTLCEFASTSREAFAEHMMVHAANGDVGNREPSTEAGAPRATNPHHHHQQPPTQHHQQPPQQPILLAANGGIVPAQATDAGLKEYLARMLTAVVPRMGAFRGQVPPQLQAQWHAHVQQQMQQQQHYQQAATNGGVLHHQGPVHHPTSPQPIQRPWLSQDTVQTPLAKPTASPPAPTLLSGEDEEVAEGMRDAAAILPSGGDEGREGRRLPNGGVPLDLTKESVPRQQSADHHLVEERQKGGAAMLGGSSRRKGRAFKLERISRNLQRGEEMEEGGSSGDEEEERRSRHSENDEESSVDSSSKRRRTVGTAEEPKVTKVVRAKEDKEDYHCPYCDIAFRDVVLYTMHMGYHGYQDPFKCNMCGQETNDKVSFFLHIARSSHS